jgi:hypothetical protein
VALQRFRGCDDSSSRRGKRWPTPTGASSRGPSSSTSADIAYTDVQAGHGNFRAWPKITSHVVTALPRLGREVPDRDVLQWVFSRLGGSNA